MAKKKSVKDKKIEDLSSTEEEIGFTDEPNISGKSIASFTFDEDNDTNKETAPSQKFSSFKTAAPKNAPTFKRSYMLTQSTIRKIDELKAKHPSVTTYVSTIVEEAINHYYDYVMNTSK